MPYLEPGEVASIGFAAVGHDVRISDTSRFYGASSITIADHARIDDHAIVTADEPVVIGRYVHIAAGVYVNGTAGVTIGDFTSLSAHVCLYSNTDDFSGPAIIGATVPDEFRNVSSAPVRIGRHCVVGAGSVLLPGADLAEGTSVGALSLVKSALAEWTLYAGIPVRAIKARSREALELERKLED